jgi:hypothetical protein
VVDISEATKKYFDESSYPVMVRKYYYSVSSIAVVLVKYLYDYILFLNLFSSYLVAE